MSSRGFGQAGCQEPELSSAATFEWKIHCRLPAQLRDLQRECGMEHAGHATAHHPVNAPALVDDGDVSIASRP